MYVYIYMCVCVCVCVLLSLYNLHTNFGPQTRDSLIGSNWPIYLMPKSKHFNSCWPIKCGTNIHQQYLTMTLFLVPWCSSPFCSQLCRVQGSARGLPGCGLNMIEHRFVQNLRWSAILHFHLCTMDTSRTCQRWPLPLTSRLPETPWLCVSFASFPPWFVKVPTTRGPGPPKFSNIVDKWLYCCYLEVSTKLSNHTYWHLFELQHVYIILHPIHDEFRTCKWWL